MDDSATAALASLPVVPDFVKFGFGTSSPLDQRRKLASEDQLISCVVNVDVQTGACHAAEPKDVWDAPVGWTKPRHTNG